MEAALAGTWRLVLLLCICVLAALNTLCGPRWVVRISLRGRSTSLNCSPTCLVGFLAFLPLVFMDFVVAGRVRFASSIGRSPGFVLVFGLRPAASLAASSGDLERHS